MITATTGEADSVATGRSSFGAITWRFSAEGRRAAVRERLRALPEGWYDGGPATRRTLTGPAAGAVQLHAVVRQRAHRTAAAAAPPARG